MSTVKLHFRPAGSAATCSVCKVTFARSNLDLWWLRHTWTDKREHYRKDYATWPGDRLVPCGKLGEPKP